MFLNLRGDLNCPFVGRGLGAAGTPLYPRTTFLAPVVNKRPAFTMSCPRGRLTRSCAKDNPPRLVLPARRRFCFLVVLRFFLSFRVARPFILNIL